MTDWNSNMDEAPKGDPTRTTPVLEGEIKVKITPTSITVSALLLGVAEIDRLVNILEINKVLLDLRTLPKEPER